MSDRETALKAEIVAWRDTGGGWDVGRMATLIEALLGAAAPPVGVSPQPDTRR